MQIDCWTSPSSELCLGLPASVPHSSRGALTQVRRVGVGLLEAMAKIKRSATWRLSYEEVTSAIAAGEIELARRLAPAQSDGSTDS